SICAKDSVRHLATECSSTGSTQRGCERAPCSTGASSKIAQNAENVATKAWRPMGPLATQRHERFALFLAQGKTATEAYVLAGYKANDGNASRRFPASDAKAGSAELPT